MTVLGVAVSIALIAAAPAGATGLGPDPSPSPGTPQPIPDPYPDRTPTVASTTPAAPVTAPSVSRPAVSSARTSEPAAASTTAPPPPTHPAPRTRPHRHAARGLSVQALARLVPDLWPPRILPSAAAAEIASGDDVPTWAALAVAAVVLASGLLVVRVGREASA